MTSSRTTLTRFAFAALPLILALGTACGPRNTTDGGGDVATGDGSGDGSGSDGSDLVVPGDGGDGGGDDGGGLDAMTSDGGLDSGGGDGSVDALPNDGRVITGDAIFIDVDGSSRACFPTTCNRMLLECGDCMDNDGDGLTDSDDPECLGPCGNSEGPTLDPNVGGGTAAACTINCYFNFGIGSGSDDCAWDHRCDPLAVPPDYPPVGMRCTYDPARVGGTTCPASQTTTCLNNCLPLTPNGCDCFGCCTFPAIQGRSAAMGGEYVFLGSRNSAGDPTCTLNDVTNTALCHSCTPSRGCLNECGRCEVCIGRPLPPADCYMTPADGGFPDVTGTDVPPGTDVPGTDVPDGGTSLQCPRGEQPCGLPGQAPCAFGYYCITGCCQAAPG